MATAEELWPSLEVPGWMETSTTMQLWLQCIGKVRLALSPMINHWWQVPFYVTARGLGTSPIPNGRGGVFEIEIDLVVHRLILRDSAGGARSLPLASGTVAGFWARLMAQLAEMQVDLRLNPFSVEMPERVALDHDRSPRRYDPDWANRFFRALIQADRLLKRFRGGFLGKASPVHFFWGGFDLAVSRFSGRPAPPHPGGIPHVGEWVMREAYSHEVSSAGFWPGDARFPEAAFYSYAYPEPRGFAEAAVAPAAARYERALGEFVLPYREVSTAANPDARVLAFLETTYSAAADRAAWDRPALERSHREGQMPATAPAALSSDASDPDLASDLFQTH